MKRLVIVTTHPIQYYAPLFQLLALEEEIKLKVFYTWGEHALSKYDPGFNKTISWDIPLLDGYEYEFLTNTSKQPGSHHFKGIVNPEAIQKIKEFKPDALLIFGWAYHSHLKIIRYFSGKIPIWFRGDSTLLDNKTGIKGALKNVFLKWVYSHVNKALFVGSNNKAYFMKYGLKDSQLVFAPHAIDNERFAMDHATDASILRKELGVKENEILILFAGKFDTVKNPLLLLEAFKQLERENVHLLFVGNGMLEERMKDKAGVGASLTLDASTTLSMTERKRKTERIHFMDFQNQSRMPVIYQTCDLFCLPSNSETWGLAVNEAMAAGRAILVSDKVGCAKDLVKDSKEGYVFKAEDQADLLQKLKLLSDKIVLKEMGKSSKESIQHWNLQKVKNIILLEFNKAI